MIIDLQWVIHEVFISSSFISQSRLIVCLYLIANDFVSPNKCCTNHVFLWNTNVMAMFCSEIEIIVKYCEISL